MSFSSIVAGLNRGISVSDTTYCGPFFTEETYPCVHPHTGVTWDCPSAVGGGAGTTTPIAALTADLPPDTDLVSVAVECGGFIVGPGTQGCSIDPDLPYYSPPCGPLAEVTVERLLQVYSTPGGPPVYQQYAVDSLNNDIPQTVTDGWFDVGGPASLGGPAEAPDWPGTGLGVGYLVNPSPTWPTPDYTGNEFGKCLWDPSEIPDTADVSFAAFLGHYGHSRGHLSVIVVPYTISENPPRDAPFMCVL